MLEDIRKRYGNKVIKKKKPLSVEVKQGIYSLLFGLILITVILSIVFLLNTSNSAQKGYIYSLLKDQNEQLENHNKELKMKVIEASSLSNLENSPKIEEMEKPESVSYLDEN